MLFIDDNKQRIASRIDKVHKHWFQIMCYPVVPSLLNSPYFSYHANHIAQIESQPNKQTKKPFQLHISDTH